MEKNEQNAWKHQQSLYDPGVPAGYGQSMEYQYLNPSQPIPRPLSPQERRLQQLREERQRRTTPLTQSGELRQATAHLSAAFVPQRMSIGKAALIITLSLTASRFLGLLQKALFTTVFVPSTVTDAFAQASLVPDLLFNIVAGGALMSAFIPVFNTYMLDKKDTQQGWHIANAALSLTMTGMVLITALVMIFAQQVVWPYNYNVPPQQLAFITTLTRIMLLQAVVMACGVVINSVLNARQHFLLPAIGTLLYPIGAIIGLLPGFMLVLLHHRDDVLAIYFATAGVVLGALFMVGIQVPGLAQVGMRFRFTLDWRHPGIRQMFRQMLPRLANTFMLNFSTAIDRILLSFLVLAVGSAGFTTVYILSFTVVSIPLSFVMALGTATFPTLSEYAATDQKDRFVAVVLEALRSILFISFPCCVGLIILGFSVVQILFEHGSFTLLYAQLTAVPLLGFAIGLPGNAVIEILTRAFYALSNSKTPVLISIWQFLLKIALSIVLLNPFIWFAQHGFGIWQTNVLSLSWRMGAWGMTALSFSTSIAVLAEAAILLWLLHQQVGSLRLRSLLSFVVRLCIATMALALTLLITLWLANIFLVTTSSDPTQSPGLIGILLVSLKVLICCAAGAFVYLRAARFLHILEVEQLGPVHRLLVRLHLSWI